MKALKITLILLLIISLISCEENGIFGIHDDQGSDDFETNFGILTNRDFIGKVIAENGNPISDAEARIGTQTALTDANGIFLINGAAVNENFAYITANKNGFIQGATSMIPSSGTNKLTIMLLEDTPIDNTNSGEAKTVTLPDGTSIKLEGDYIDQNGISYSGAVTVFLYNTPISEEKIENILTGMPYAEGKDGRENYLESYGMIAIELRGSSGEILDLSENSTAEISIPIKTDLQTNAPTTIPLWYFDKEKGYWKEGEEANLEGQNYIGTIDRLSFWNFSANFSTRIVKVTVIDSENTVITNQPLSLSYTSSDYPYNSITDYTNSEGITRLLVPSKTINFEIYDHTICGTNTIHSESLGSGSADQEKEITISGSNLFTNKILGSFTTCSDETDVALGYVSFKLGEEEFYDPIYDGVYNMNILHCTDAGGFQIKATDYSNDQNTGTINYFFVDPITHLGEPPVCNNVTEFIQFTIDGGTTKTLVVTNIIAELSPLNIFYGTPSLSISTITGEFSLFGLLDNTPYIGVYENYEFGSSINRGMNMDNSINASVANNDISYNLVKLGNVDEFIDMHFSGAYEDMSGNSHTIVGVIHVLRDE